ncbi:protein kinase family protein [Pseudomonas argentinensis]|uniref:Serine/threonine protein kinase n=1 Tax=Phytopseudomonas argentinensis TaxID=289370 RepID=A0A1I3KNZ2_9GAMM|nr:protein kinase family protein [Pseudomonas argentinensis]KAB0550477.1 protein kinase family protein [Pseudomonas argentinensis]SFI74209.1 Serine/threonine protein kinase [Pseudomonas argentinensis]
MPVDILKLPVQAQAVLAKFPEFQISDFNDSGANGYILIGRHNVLRKEVAIKIYFHPKDEIDQEPSIISAINHDHILKVYDARKIEETCSYYMMQVANDGDLHSFLTRYDISLGLAHKLLCQLLSGLSELHSSNNKIVHRDLKPENLLVHNDTIVIADFGSVRRINDDTGRAPASKHSILYRPPEAFGENAYFDFSSDTYQAGMIGFLLFGGKLSNDLLKQLSKAEIKELREIERTAHPCDASLFIDKCIEKRTASGKILDWESFPFYVPAKIKKTLKTATSKIDNRYKNTSEFLLDLSRSKSTLPDWIRTENGYELENWNKNDYLLTEDNDKIILKKRKHGTKNYRTDNSICGDNYNSAYALLKEQIGLP